MARKRYPSDVTREQFEKIEPLLIASRKVTRPREVDLYEVFCGVLYVLKSGCQWRMVPSDLPNHSTLYWYWRIWSESHDDGSTVLEAVLKKIGWRGAHAPWAQTHHLVSDY